MLMVDGEGRRRGVYRLIHMDISSRMFHSTSKSKLHQVYLHRSEISNLLFRIRYLQQEKIFLKQNARTLLPNIVNEWDGLRPPMFLMGALCESDIGIYELYDTQISE
jgi:hypothetical protein